MPCPNYWNMHSWGGWMIFHGAFWLLLLVLVIVAAIVLTRGLLWQRGFEHTTSALDVLAERYARGEISRDEHLHAKSDILSDKGTQA